MTFGRLVGIGVTSTFVFGSIALSQGMTTVLAQNKPTDRAAVTQEKPIDRAAAEQNKPTDRAPVTASGASAATERKRPLSSAQMVAALERVLEQVKASPAVTATDVRAVEQALDAARDDRFLDARRRTHTPSPRR